MSLLDEERAKLEARRDEHRRKAEEGAPEYAIANAILAVQTQLQIDTLDARWREVFS